MEHTKEQLKNEIDRIKQVIYRTLDFDTRKAIMYRQLELMDKTGINKTKNGVQRYYLTKNAKKEVVDDYLECLINATYDVLGHDL
jgi:hypothetical protein